MTKNRLTLLQNAVRIHRTNVGASHYSPVLGMVRSLGERFFAPTSILKNPSILKKHLYLFFVFGLLLSSQTMAASHHPEDFLASIQGSPDAGKQIYLHFCATCHAAENPMISIGAPRMGVESDWEPYTKSQNLDQMIQIINNGVGAMPARGGCFECSDKDLKAAVAYMLPK